MSQSLYRTLKANNPDATIDVMAPDWCRPILSRMPEVNNVVAMPVGHGSLQLSVRRQLGKTLKQNGYDQAIVLPGSLKSAWYLGLPALQSAVVGLVKCVMAF